MAERLSLQQLKKLVRKAGIRSAKAYNQRYREIPGAPSSPDAAYRGEWVSWCEFFDKPQVKPRTFDRTPLDFNAVISWAEWHMSKYGKPPISTSTEKAPGQTATWEVIFGAAGRGLRGLPKVSLYRLLIEHFGLNHPCDGMTAEEIEQGAETFVEHNHRPPLSEDAYNDRLSWKMVYGWYAGITGKSLRMILEQRFSRPTMTAAWLKARVRHHIKATGTTPTVNSGRLLDAPVEVWRSIDGNLRHGSRGFPGGSSLSLFIDEHLPNVPKSRIASKGPKPVYRPSLTLKKVLADILNFRRTTGGWPQATSGMVGEGPDTWGEYDRCLRQGLRGLPARMSLRALKAALREELEHRTAMKGSKPCQPPP